MKIKGITLLINTGACDILLIKTNLPSAIWPFEGNMVLKSEIAAGNGIDYCKKNFPNWFTRMKIKDLS